eukprot:12898377-Prorocentrum_lima.AAC.1
MPALQGPALRSLSHPGIELPLLVPPGSVSVPDLLVDILNHLVIPQECEELCEECMSPGQLVGLQA